MKNKLRFENQKEMVKLVGGEWAYRSSVCCRMMILKFDGNSFTISICWGLIFNLFQALKKQKAEQGIINLINNNIMLFDIYWQIIHVAMTAIKPVFRYSLNIKEPVSWLLRYAF